MNYGYHIALSVKVHNFHRFALCCENSLHEFFLPICTYCAHSTKSILRNAQPRLILEILHLEEYNIMVLQIWFSMCNWLKFSVYIINNSTLSYLLLPSPIPISPFPDPQTRPILRPNPQSYGEGL